MTSTPKTSTGSKLALSFGLILASSAYALSQHRGSSPTPTTPSYQEVNQALQQTLARIVASTTPTPDIPTGVPTPQPTITTPVVPAGRYINGSYTGSSADAYYGTVQVKVVVTAGKISDVQFLQYPSDRSTSRAINSQAMPLLTQEAIQAQSANVDGVSGATATSGAFIQSLTSALALAKK